MNLLEQIQRIERIDQLIRMKATGTPDELASRLSLSDRSVRRLIKMMRDMGAPIRYCTFRRSYCYKEKVHFRFGFYCKKEETEKMYGGLGRFLGVFSVFFNRRSNFDHESLYYYGSNITNRNSIS